MAFRGRWKSFAVATAAAVAVAFAAGGTAWALRGGGPPTSAVSGTGARGAFVAKALMLGRRRFLRRVTSAQVSVEVGGAAQVIRIDHGTVGAIASGSVTLREADGRAVTVPIDAATRVTLDGEPVPASRIATGDEAIVVRRDGSPARILRARDGSARRTATGQGA